MVFVGSILTASNFLKEHSSDITLMTPYSEGIHLAHSFRTQKTHKDAHEKEMGFCLTHYLCSIFNNYLVNKGHSLCRSNLLILPALSVLKQSQHLLGFLGSQGNIFYLSPFMLLLANQPTSGGTFSNKESLESVKVAMQQAAP